MAHIRGLYSFPVNLSVSSYLFIFVSPVCIVIIWHSWEMHSACMHAESLLSCPTLCNPMDYSPPLLSMEFSRQEHWSGLPCPLPGDLPDPGIEPASFMSPALAGRFFTSSATWKASFLCIYIYIFFYNHTEDNKKRQVSSLFFSLKVKMSVTQSCLTLCDPMACTPPGSSVYGILQAKYWSGLPFRSPGCILRLSQISRFFL